MEAFPVACSLLWFSPVRRPAHDVGICKAGCPNAGTCDESLWVHETSAWHPGSHLTDSLDVLLSALHSSLRCPARCYTVRFPKDTAGLLDCAQKSSPEYMVTYCKRVSSGIAEITFSQQCLCTHAARCPKEQASLLCLRVFERSNRVESLCFDHHREV